MNQQLISKEITKLLLLSREISTTTNLEVIFSYHGTTDGIHISVIQDKETFEPIYTANYWINPEYPNNKTLSEIYNDLQGIKYEAEAKIDAMDNAA